MNDAIKFVVKHNNIKSLIAALNDECVESKEDLVNRKTTWTFNDGSTITASDNEVHVK